MAETGHQFLVADPWVERYEQIALANRRQLRFLQGLLEQFDQLGIEVVPLKGMDLLLRAYPGLGRRPMYDIDLLVLPRDVPRVSEFLRGHGFHRKPPPGLFCESFFDSEMEYISMENDRSVDLSWGFWYLDGLERIWPRCVRRPTPVGPRRLLHPEDALLYMVAYTVAHRGQLAPVFSQDLDAFLKKESSEIDWPKWCQEVKRCHLSVPVHHGLSYVHAQGCREFPSEVLSRLRPRSVGEETLAWYYQHMVTERQASYDRYLFPFVTGPGWRGRWRLLRQTVFPSRVSVELRLGHPVNRWAYWRRTLFRPLWIAFRAPYFVAREMKRRSKI